MIRVFLTLFLAGFLGLAEEDINKKIESTSQQIDKFSQSYTSLNKKMAQNAKAILEQKLEIQKQQKYLKELKALLEEKEHSYEESKTQLDSLSSQNNSLKKEQDEIQQELVFVIAQSVSLSVILQDSHSVDEESLMEFEVLHEMLRASKEKAAKLNEKYYANSKDIEILNKEAQVLKQSIENIDSKRKNLISTQEKNKKSLKKLEVAKSSYKKQVKSLIRKQNLLKDTLSKLNIIKRDEARKAKEAEEQKLAFENQKEILEEQKDLPKVKKHGSSYQAVKTKKYTGPKTIAPLDSYTISKKYGTYTDPIYGIKIFNESISLKPTTPNAKVKTVFNGKVIYADKTAVLNNIVIVEHKNGLHTIYANLSQISPNIKKGKKIKKGYSIGRVDEELVFEVTQKSYHINPIRLFK